MKRVTKILFVIILVVVFIAAALLSFGAIPLNNSSVSTAHDKALAFIKNVLPIDSTKYNITLESYHVPELPDIGLANPINDKQEILTYLLESKDSTLKVICTIQNGFLKGCTLDVLKGSVISDRPYTNVVDIAKSFLQKYQAYSSMDSTEMIAMLLNVDPTKNATITSGNLKLTVTHRNLTGTFFGDSINFRWVQTFNGCDYLPVSIGFSDGVFSGFLDHRGIYKIGDTRVNISKAQAIKIAMEAVKNYSYRMSDDWVVTGFNVIEDQAVANLHPQVRESNVLYPAWSITLPLNGTYPGSVRELLVGIWAGSGEVYFVHHQAYSYPYP